MWCPECGKENPEGAKFCGKCGASLVRSCAQCGAHVPPDPELRFCLECGTQLQSPTAPGETVTERLQRLVPKEYADRLLATRGQVTKERRTVTILFSDVKGSTAMAEGLDPEEVMEIMDGAFDVLIEPVYRYEGTLARLMGDAVLAFFGAPIAHEDDAERAILAALDIIAGAKQYAARLETERGISGFNVRVGINTGLVVMGEVGSDLRVEYTAMGDAVNLAARMESAAQPGTVLITEATHKLIAPLFETEALGSVQVKGKVERVSVYRVLSAKEVPGKVRGISGLESPLVGREVEFAALLEGLQRLEAGVGGIITITGEAGIGKSRLVAEGRKQTGAAVQWVEGRCLSYGTSTAYLLWLDVLREWIAVAGEDALERVAAALRDRVQMLCPERFDGVYPYLARLISLPLEGEQEAALSKLEGEKLKARTFQAVEELIECAARQRPLAIVCEDLHWADPTSIELLEQLLALTDRVSVLFICVFRPDPGHGSWHMRETAAREYRHRHTSLHLQPLSVVESASLVSNLLQAAGAPAGAVEDLPPPLKERILQVTEGNPLYVEEVLRSLVDEGALVRDESGGRWRGVLDVVDIALPGTLQGVLLSRIDRLQEDTKRVLQMASVIGRIFLYRVLEAIAKEERELDRHLLTLQRQEMIRERTRIPELGYIFKHELTREAAYNGLLKKQRRLFHRQVAEALERLFPDRIEEQLGLLAHHWERAGVSDRAVDYMVRAGDQAQREYACREAIEHYTRALELVEAARVPDQALAASILERRAKAYIAPDGMGLARQDLHRVLAWSRQVGNRRKEAETLLDLIMPLLTGHEIDEAMACAQQAKDIAVALEDNLLVARSTGALGGAYCTKGELDKANTYLQAALAAAKATGATECVGEALFYAMMERNWVADFRGALALVAETMELAEEVRDPNWAYRALFVGALANCGLGEYELALVKLSQAEELAEKAQMTLAPAELLNLSGWVYQEVYNLEKSTDLNAKCADVAQEFGETESEANALVNLGVDHLLLGDLAAAEERFVQAWELLDKQFGGFRWRWKTRLLAAWGELSLARGDVGRALEYAAQCLQLAERTSARKNLIKGWKLRGEALAAQDRLEEAVHWLQKALYMAEEIGNPPLQWKSAFALARVEQRLGQHRQARQHHMSAAATVERTAGKLSDLAMREAFLSAGPVRAVLNARDETDPSRAV